MNKNNYILSRKIYRFKTISKYQKKAKLLGYKEIDEKVFLFLNLRLITSLLLFILILLLSNFNYIIASLITCLFYFTFTYYMFDYRIKKRELKLEKEAIYFFDILLLSLESGKNLIQGLKLTANSIDSELSKEFLTTLREIDYGKSFHDALTDLRNRIPSDSIQNIILNLSESYSSGENITNTLTKQIDYIENKRIMDIKKVINQIPIKVSIVSVFLLIPLVLLLILSPVILEYFGI